MVTLKLCFKPLFRKSEIPAWFHCISIRGSKGRGWNLTCPMVYLSPLPKPVYIRCQELIWKYKQWRSVTSPSNLSNQTLPLGMSHGGCVSSLGALPLSPLPPWKFRLILLSSFGFALGSWQPHTCASFHQLCLNWERFEGAAEEFGLGVTEWGTSWSVCYLIYVFTIASPNSVDPMSSL